MLSRRSWGCIAVAAAGAVDLAAGGFENNRRCGRLVGESTVRSTHGSAEPPPALMLPGGQVAEPPPVPIALAVSHRGPEAVQKGSKSAQAGRAAAPAVRRYSEHPRTTFRSSKMTSRDTSDLPVAGL